MKKIENKLFQKFEDAKILDETAKKITGGTPAYSEQTGDHECTGGGEAAPDCADFVNGPTDVFADGIWPKQNELTKAP